MHLNPVLIVSADDTWRRCVADAVLARDLLVYCATSVDEAVGFLRAGIEPLLLVLDARRREDVAGLRRQQLSDAQLRRYRVVAVVGGRDLDGTPVAGIVPWDFVQIGGVEAAVREAIERVLELRGG